MSEVKARMLCLSKIEGSHYGGGKSKKVILKPVTATSEVNKQFFEATPNGVLELETLNDAAYEAFTPGKEYEITISQVD